MDDAPLGYRPCGGCTLCCKLPRIDDPALTKPAGTWCGHCKPGSGCKIHDRLPESCRTFQCAWTHLRRSDQMLPESWRPDRIKAYLIGTAEGDDLVVVVDPQRPDAWSKGELGAALHRMALAGGIAILVEVGARRFRLVEDKGEVIEVEGILESDDGRTAVYTFPRQ